MNKAASMDTRFITADDGTRIAYDVQGTGPALILLHGGEQNRQYWHTLGYVSRLSPAYRVITIDIRGNGESDKPEDPTFYAYDRHLHDVLAVADACVVDQFGLWGFSYGGYIGRYLAAHGDRVQAFVMIGIAFGLGASGDFRARVEQLRDYWAPIVRAHHEGTLDLAPLSEADQAEYQRNTAHGGVAWGHIRLARD
jgi:pimeloyl-ACP methyl ester carboxylesterase